MNVPRATVFKHVQSRPNLLLLSDDNPQVNYRKRKYPDQDTYLNKEELQSSLANYRSDMNQSLTVFQRNILASFEELLSKQNDNICKLREDVASIRYEINKIKKTGQDVQNEHCTLSTNLLELRKDTDNLHGKVDRIEREFKEAVNNTVAVLSNQIPQ